MRRALTVATAIAGLVAGASAAHASWLAGGAGTAVAMADVVADGATPTAAAVGNDVTVSWSQTAFADGTPVEGYAVRRYDLDGTPFAAGGNCGGTVTTLTCTEVGVPPGTWHYTVQPLHGLWRGADSPTPSDAVTIGTTATSIHVTGLFDESARSGSSAIWQPRAGVSVANDLGQPVSDVTVTGDFTPIGHTGRTCTTDATGTCIVAIQGNTNTTNDVTFTVTGLGHGSLTYHDDPDPPTITLTPP